MTGKGFPSPRTPTAGDARSLGTTLGLFLVFLAGCSSSTVVDEGNGPPAQPLLVDAQVAVELSAGGASGLPDARGTIEPEWTRRLVERLDLARAFARVSAIPQDPGREGQVDLKMRVRLTSLVDEGLPESETRTSLAVLNGFLWFAAGIPSWFIPDRQYGPVYRVELSVERQGLDLQAAPAAPDTRGVSLSFWDRAAPEQFFFQIIVPPPLLPESQDDARESLREAAAEEVIQAAARYARSWLPLEHVNHGSVFVFHPLVQTPAEEGLLVLSRGRLVKVRVNGTNPRGVPEGRMAQFIESARESRPAFEEEKLQKLCSHLRALARELPDSTEEVPDVEGLRQRFPGVYWFTEENLRDERNVAAENLELTTETGQAETNPVVRWTLPLDLFLRLRPAIGASRAPASAAVAVGTRR